MPTTLTATADAVGSGSAPSPQRGRSKARRATPLLEVNEAQKSYGRGAARKEVLRGLSFELHAGEFLAVLGPNGAGKTTMIRSIAGRLGLDGGEIRLGGDLVRPGRTRRRLGLVPQDLAVYPDLTARENLRTFGRLHGVKGSRLRDRVEAALEWIGLADRANDLVGTFSGGMKRRVNFACGVLHDPHLVLLDEPTVGVDPQSRERIFDMLESLRKPQGRHGGTSFLITTHHLEEAEARCDRIVIVDHGRVIAAGTPQELIRSTVGTASQVSVRCDRVLQPAGGGLELDSDGQTIHARLGDLAVELPQLLEQLSGLGIGVEDVHVTRPGLQQVFLHLTGRTLRE